MDGGDWGAREAGRIRRSETPFNLGFKKLILHPSANSVLRLRDTLFVECVY